MHLYAGLVPGRATTFNPTLYQAGRPLELQVRKSYSPDLPSRVTATISKVLSMTMSVVLDVTFQTRHGLPVHHVLKLYDRRFGSCLREVDGDRVAPHTQENEAAFEAFVRRGMMPGFLRHRHERNDPEESVLPVGAREFLDEPNRTEGLAKYEAALWQDCSEHFECETKAYHRLAKLQGTVVPHLYAYVSLLSATKPATIIPPEVAPYFEVRGILLERIDGYCLDNLTLGPLPKNLRTWQHIIQLAADAAYEINKHGIIMEDCTPRNVVVDGKSQTPRIVDLAQCMFRDEMVSEWYKSGWHEDEDWDPELEYWEQVSTTCNPGAIAAVMANRIYRKTGAKLEFRYPDWSEIFAKIRRRREEAAARARKTPRRQGR
ncbi:uncharacterized protein C8A04DRAFT_37008 [Dichotomopilus funicola]|uniref:Protein kinase domain-containing protein n=1 Tax=Dichotomopilus funicola TaxID=1934379 RepID=A0AAN6ZNX5_9PEZI|nr:hypothetical protein C8A04DRAFT_37008 [Dichotomopilus funicola]